MKNQFNNKRNVLKKSVTFATALVCLVATLTAPSVAFADTTTASTEETATVTDGRTVPHYDLTQLGGTWDGTHYYLSDGTLATQCFFTDGTYTYYLQNDGTPMTDRLTYHPDGTHVIYFDANGHEVFSNFSLVKHSIAGDSVNDLCFFDTYGYMYVDKLTYDQAGVNLYYVNPYGVIERSGWFTFSDGGKGYANTDGTLMVNANTYDQFGNAVYIQGNGYVQGTEKVYSGRNGVNPNVTVVTGDYSKATGSHGKMVIDQSKGTITYGGYSFSIADINACSANFTGKTFDGYRYGNTWYNGVNWAGVFAAEAYLDYPGLRNAGFTEDNAINHWINNGICSGNYSGCNSSFSFITYAERYYSDLYAMYGSDMTYYNLDWLAHGYAEGKTGRDNNNEYSSNYKYFK